MLRVGFHEQGRVESDKVHALIGAEKCQVVRTGGDIRRPGCGARTRRKVDGVEHIGEYQSRNKPDNGRNRALRFKEHSADCDYRADENQPVGPLREL